LFIPPNFSFSIQREEDVLTLLFFLLMAALTGNLAARQRRQLQALRDTQEETSELLDLSRKLTAATDRQAVVSAAAQHLNGWSDLQLCLLNRDGQGGWKVETGGPLQFSESERAAADWAWQHDQPAGMGTGTLPLGRWWWWPLSVDDGPLALLGVCAKEGQTLSGQRRRLLTALSQPLAQALARAQLADDLEAARLHGETEQLRSALLASVSHDLRTPLTAMRGSIDSLLALGEAIPLEDRRELLEGTRDEAERLDRYIQNLLDMTRLGHGALKLARDWVSPADIVGSSLNRLRAVLAPLQVSTDVPAELPLLFVHAALIEQALVNVLENAARFRRLTVVCNSAPEPMTKRFSSRSATKGQGFPRKNGRRFSTCSTPPHAVIAAARARASGWRSVRAWSVRTAGASVSPTASTDAAPASPCTCRCRRNRGWTMKPDPDCATLLPIFCVDVNS
jgi:two-component system sensor histidine kinase KdpD